METYLSDSKEDEVQIKMNRTKVKSAVSIPGDVDMDHSP